MEGVASRRTALPIGTLMVVTGAPCTTGVATAIRACGACTPHRPTGASGTEGALVEKIWVVECPPVSVNVSCTSYSPDASGTKLGVAVVGLKIAAALPAGWLAKLQA